MVTSDFGPEVEIWPFGACAMKYMHYIQITCEVPRISSDHSYRNSSVIVDLAMGQIPRSIERISS